MTDPGYVITVADRAESDIRGGARLIIVQLGRAFMNETPARINSALQGAVTRASALRGKAEHARQRELIIVTPVEPSSALKNIATDMGARIAGLTVEIHMAERFAIVVPEHVMVPHHEILPDEVAARICDEMHIMRSDLPIIRSDDPMAVWLGLRPKMIIRVDRLVETVGIDVIYQRCV